MTFTAPNSSSSRYRKPTSRPLRNNSGTRTNPRKTTPTGSHNFPLGTEVRDLESIVSRSLRRTGIWTARSQLTTSLVMVTHRARKPAMSRIGLEQLANSRVA
jgi:hypothetical protein